MIAHALELVRRVQEPEDLAQVPGNGCLGEDHGEAVLVHLSLASVDGAVAGDDPGCHLDVPVEQGAGGVCDRHVDHLALLEHELPGLTLRLLQRGTM